MTPLFGLETEFGLAAQDRPEEWNADDHDALAVANDQAAWQLVDAVRQLTPALPDLGGSGAFLSNGSRVYVDAGHLESATPEVSTPWEIVRYVLAGHRLLEKALAGAAGPGGPRPLLFRTNVDYLSWQSWGCHESILCGRGTFDALELLIPHLVSRVVFAGAGGFDPRSPGISFVLSPRALFLSVPVSRSSTDHRRGLVHRKDEPLAAGPYKRLHLICGDSLCSEQAMWLRTATTVLVAAMIDAGLDTGPPIVLADPVAALHAMARDPSCHVKVPLADGRAVTALELQRHYLRAAASHAGASCMPAWAPAACRSWRAMLDLLERAPDSVVTTLDWGIKRALFARVLARHGLSWTSAARWTAALREVMAAFTPSGAGHAWPDPGALLAPGIEAFPASAHIQPILHGHGFDRKGLAPFLRARRALFECDVRFGQLGGGGLFDMLDRDEVLTHRVPGVGDVARAIEHPPEHGRAHVRGDAIRRLAGDAQDCVCDWTCITNRQTGRSLDLADPFEQEERWRPSGERRTDPVTESQASTETTPPAGSPAPGLHPPALDRPEARAANAPAGTTHGSPADSRQPAAASSEERWIVLEGRSLCAAVGILAGLFVLAFMLGCLAARRSPDQHTAPSADPCPAPPALLRRV
jgi:hypothetical protein